MDRGELTNPHHNPREPPMQMTLTHLMDDRARATDTDERRFCKLDRTGPRRPLPRPVTRRLRKGERLLLMMQRYERGEQLFHPEEAV